MIRIRRVEVTGRFSKTLVSLLGLVVIICLFAGCAERSTPSPEFSAKSEGISKDMVLFATRSPSHYRLCTVNADGTNLIDLLDIETPHPWALCSSLSPDGSRVVFFSAEDYLSVLRIDSGEVTKLVDTPQEGKVVTGYIAWSPDGSKIAYTSNRDLYVVNADGSANKKLAEHNSGEYANRGTIEDQTRRPMWSADGNYILFDDFRAPSFYMDGTLRPDVRLIYAVNEATDVVKSLAYGRLGHQTSDRTKILIETKSWVWSVMDITTSVQVGTFELPDHGILEELKLPEKLIDCKWSPDSSVIAAIARYRGEQGWKDELWMLDAITGEKIAMMGEINDVDQLIWSPDGQHIAYAHGYVGWDEIHIARHDLSHDFLIYQGLGPREGEEKQRIELLAWLSQK